MKFSMAIKLYFKEQVTTGMKTDLVAFAEAWHELMV